LSGTYLAACLEAYTLQFRAHGVNDVEEVPEERDILLAEDLEIIIVDIRGKEGMSDFSTNVP
jgi:hypothetical protein